mgnify:CR=1 FL=1
MELLQSVRPQHFLPVHGEYAFLTEHALLAKTRAGVNFTDVSCYLYQDLRSSVINAFGGGGLLSDSILTPRLLCTLTVLTYQYYSSS